MKDTLSKRAAKQFLTRCLNSGEILVTKHCREKMVKCEFDLDDIGNVIWRGEVVTVAYDASRENFQVEMEGKDLEGVGLTLELALEIEDNLTIVITGFSERHR